VYPRHYDVYQCNNDDNNNIMYNAPCSRVPVGVRRVNSDKMVLISLRVAAGKHIGHLVCIQFNNIL